MNTVLSHPAPLAAITFPRFTPTPAERAELDRIVAELDRLDGELEKVADLRAILADAGEAFARGDLGIFEAVAVLANAGLDNRHDVQVRLQGALKARGRAVAAEGAGIVSRWREGRIRHLAEAARKVEEVERKTAQNIGIAPDDFQPSETLLRLRENHRREVEASREQVADFRGLIRQLVAEIEPLAAPTTKRTKGKQTVEADEGNLAAELDRDFH